MIGGLTPDGRFYSMIRDTAIDGIKCVAFLKHLQHFISERLLVIWDGGTIHRCEETKWFLATQAGRKVTLEPLPGYAPDLNPAEGAWQHLKHVAMRNLCCTDFSHLHRALTYAIIQLKQQPELIQSFFGQAGLDISEWEIN